MSADPPASLVFPPDAEAAALDAADPLAAFRAAFRLPPGVIYLDGNSLGPLPEATPGRMAAVVEAEWGRSLIRGWNDHDWFTAPTRVGDKIARLIGANPGEVIVADSTSANLFKLICAALQAAPERSVVVSEPGDFPTDLYMIEGAVRTLGAGRRLELLPAHEIAGRLGPDVALLVLSHVHYKTARMRDMAALTAAARAARVMTLWDLSHSGGVLEVDLNGCGVDLAVGCGYKYLNGGPGAPAWLFVAERHQERLVSPLSGWMGHAAPFAFDDAYAPAVGITRFACGTPTILGVSALEVGVDLAIRAGPGLVAAKARALGDLFIRRTAHLDVDLASPADPARRGGHVSLRHPDAYAVVQALIARGVIGDFRAPDLMRFGFSPLPLSFAEVAQAAHMVEDVLTRRLYDDPAYRVRAAVT